MFNYTSDHTVWPAYPPYTPITEHYGLEELRIGSEHTIQEDMISIYNSNEAFKLMLRSLQEEDAPRLCLYEIVLEHARYGVSGASLYDIISDISEEACWKASTREDYPKYNVDDYGLKSLFNEAVHELVKVEAVHINIYKCDCWRNFVALDLMKEDTDEKCMLKCESSK